ncbi:MAG: hypothetical protein V2B18_25725 [Pseudomonadota bacterium]
MRDPIHVILEYNPSPEFNPEAPNTILNHIAVINKHGSVLWPKVSKSGRTELHREDVPRINEQIKQGGPETHFYMYAPEHRDYPRTLHVGLLKHVHFPNEVDSLDERIPKMYRMDEGPLSVMYYFELGGIKEVDLSELDNLLIYPHMTFLDLVSFISPQRVLEAERREFFG